MIDLGKYSIIEGNGYTLKNGTVATLKRHAHPDFDELHVSTDGEAELVVYRNGSPTRLLITPDTAAVAERGEEHELVIDGELLEHAGPLSLVVVRLVGYPTLQKTPKQY